MVEAIHGVEPADFVGDIAMENRISIHGHLEVLCTYMPTFLQSRAVYELIVQLGILTRDHEETK